MEDSNKFVVKMSRLALIFYMSFGVGAVGLIMLLTWIFKDGFNGEYSSNLLVIGLVYLFMLGGGLAITIQQLLYMLNPPTLMTVSDKEITFASGFRYKQYAIPMKYVKNAGFSIIDRHGIALSGANPFPVGIIVYFEAAADVPSGMATPIGVKYFMHTLKISRFHANRGIKETIDAINSLKKMAGKWS
ncbi:MAG: hypothetical protein Q8P68_03165 [Candidatus Peregrinibacteria bacterium]|nr:hypothetical protein [Candidatus Peregrinibacteria bacterium]MDZ4244826.1 hypothetical protein [Candidatus Gracilibacteria bacterium]